MATPPEPLQEQVARFFAATPQALLYAVCSYLSGQVWVYLVLAYFKTGRKGNSSLNAWATKVALGALWFLPFVVAVHIFKFGLSEMVASSLIRTVLEAVIFGGVAQLIIFAVLTSRRR